MLKQALLFDLEEDFAVRGCPVNYQDGLSLSQKMAKRMVCDKQKANFDKLQR